MKNILKQFEKDGTQFFVTKSFMYAKFEVDRKKPEYHIFFVKKNSNPDAYHMGYMNLKERKMNKKELKYFKDNIDNYDLVMENNYGAVFNLKARPFDKSLCPPFKQYILNL